MICSLRLNFDVYGDTPGDVISEALARAEQLAPAGWGMEQARLEIDMSVHLARVDGVPVHWSGMCSFAPGRDPGPL